MTDISVFQGTYVDVTILSSAELSIATVRDILFPPRLLPLTLTDTLPEVTTNITQQISASVPAMISLFRRLMGKRGTTKGSSGTPGASRTPGASVTSGLSSSQGRKKVSRDRWHGFTDVFSTRGAATVVTRTHADYSNDEFELLEDPVVQEPGPQTMDHNGHPHSSDQQTRHGHDVDYNEHSGFSNHEMYHGQSMDYNGHPSLSYQEAYHVQNIHENAPHSREYTGREM